MPDKFSGGCACGAIRYTCTAAPRYMGVPLSRLPACHGQCLLPGRAGAQRRFHARERGESSWYESVSDRGSLMRRGFCSTCGSPLFLQNDANETVTVLFAGSLDDPSWYKPSRDIFVKSAQPWDLMHPDIPKSDGML